MTDSDARADADRARQARERMESPEKFFRAYWPRLARFLKSRANNAEWAEDIASEAMIAVLDNWDELLTYDRPDSWLFKVAMQKLRHVEARARDLCYLHEDPLSARSDLQAASAFDGWIAQRLDLITAIRSLPRRQCEVVGLHFFGGFTLAETGRILGIDVGTVKKHLSRGLEALRRHHALQPALATSRKVQS